MTTCHGAVQSRAARQNFRGYYTKLPWLLQYEGGTARGPAARAYGRRVRFLDARFKSLLKSFAAAFFCA